MRDEILCALIWNRILLFPSLHHERSFPHVSPSLACVFSRLFVFFFFSNILFFIYWKFAAATTSSKLFWSLSTGKSLSISHPTYCIAKPSETNIRTIAPEHWLFSVCMALLWREKNFLPFPMFTIKHPTVRSVRFYLSVRQQIDKYASVRIERVRGRGRASYPNANIRGIK